MPKNHLLSIFIKISALIFFVSAPCLVVAQVVYADFENQQLQGWFPEAEGNWCIRNVDAAGDRYALHHCHDDSVAGVDWMACFHDPLLLQQGKVSWQMKIRYDSKPSANNRWCVYLTSGNVPDAFGIPEEGYFIGVNCQGSEDFLQLGELAEGREIQLNTTAYNWQEHVASGEWITLTLEYTPSDSLRATITDSYSHETYLGAIKPEEAGMIRNLILALHYTASHDQSLWFDELSINGNATQDTESPYLKRVVVINPYQIEIEFSEPVLFLQETEITVYQLGSSLVGRGLHSRILLQLPYALEPGRSYGLNVPQLQDVFGNSNLSCSYTFYYPARNDVVFSEVMVDPSPPVLLPEAEYIEIVNRSSEAFWIKNWRLMVNQLTVTLPSTLLQPGCYYLICAAETAPKFTGVARLLATDPFPALSNSGARLVLVDASGRAIHSLMYQSSWHELASCRNGGYALEMRNTNEPCLTEGNWGSSTDYTGGTPGQPNSIAPDSERPDAALWRVAVTDSGTLKLYFSEPVDSLLAADPMFYSVNKGMGHPQQVHQGWPQSQVTELVFQQPLRKGEHYTLSVTADVCTCTGASFLSEASVTFCTAEKPLPGEIRLNEVLYEPCEGCIEFIELRNVSDKTLELKGCYLSVEVGDTGSDITTEYWPLPPEGYVVLAQSFRGIDGAEWFSRASQVVYMEDFPSLRNTGSYLQLTSPDHEVLDAVNYFPDDHHPILVDTKGVSLERIHAESGGGKKLWQSASADAGFMTPASPNSQEEQLDDGSIVVLSSKVITPNGDGAQEQLIIQYRLALEGSIGRVYIYNAGGVLQKVLAEGTLLGTHGEIIYQGTDRSDALVPDGYYLVYFEALHPSGEKFVQKKSFVVAR